MYVNNVYRNVSKALPDLLAQLLDAPEVGSRAGRTRELTMAGTTLTHPLEREVLVRRRKPSLAAQIAETVWVLSGQNDIGWLEHYLPRAKEFSDDGKTWRAGYGKRLRSWYDEMHSVDQWAYAVDLLKKDRGTRQAVLSIWDPSVDTQPGKDIPCNDWLSFLSRDGKLDLHVALRSNDIIWGWSGINQFEWSVLLEITAALVGADPGALHFSTTSFHLYDRHFAAADRIVEATDELLTEPGLAPSPRFSLEWSDESSLRVVDELLSRWLEIEKAIRYGDPSSDAVDTFPEPMLQSWLRVLQWWWTGNRYWLRSLEGTRLERATRYSIQPKVKPEPVSPKGMLLDAIRNGVTIQVHPKDLAYVEPSDFLRETVALHIQKDAAYGNSWKKRGELLSILPNIARKVDRLGNGETDDETQADTAADLFVYLAKYTAWLEDPALSDDVTRANAIMRELDARMSHTGQDSIPAIEYMENFLKKEFETVADLSQQDEGREGSLEGRVTAMLEMAYFLARCRWDNSKTAGDEYRGADHD